MPKITLAVSGRRTNIGFYSFREAGRCVRDKYLAESKKNTSHNDTSIITNNLMLILGAILASAAISYGLASRDVLSNILAGFFSRRTFGPGQVIEIDGVRGKIISSTNISVTLQTDEKEWVVIPAHQLITSKVKIIG